jgi:hypothetical protein
VHFPENATRSVKFSQFSPSDVHFPETAVVRASFPENAARSRPGARRVDWIGLSQPVGHARTVKSGHHDEVERALRGKSKVSW